MEEFDGWYRQDYSRVLAACTALAGDVHLARDAVDEAFVRAFERWPSVAVMASPGGWVQVVALNRLRWVLRSRKHERAVLARRRTTPNADGQSVPDPDLWAAVAALPRRQRAVIVLRYVHDLPEATIGQVLDISRGTWRRLCPPLRPVCVGCWPSPSVDTNPRTTRRSSMVDLRDAGRRLSQTTVGPVPSLVQLEARRAARARRRRVVIGLGRRRFGHGRWFDDLVGYRDLSISPRHHSAGSLDQPRRNLWENSRRFAAFPTRLVHHSRLHAAAHRHNHDCTRAGHP